MFLVLDISPLASCIEAGYCPRRLGHVLLPWVHVLFGGRVDKWEDDLREELLCLRELNA